MLTPILCQVAPVVQLVKIKLPKLGDKLYFAEVKENYTKEMKQYIEEQLAVTMKELGYPEDVRYNFYEFRYLTVLRFTGLAKLLKSIANKLDLTYKNYQQLLNKIIS